MSTQVTPIASYRGSSSALDHRGWNLPLAFQELFTAIVRLRYGRQSATSADSFRAQIMQALRQAEQESRARGYSPEDIRQVTFAVVAFLDESVLSCRNPVFADWPRLPLQTELFGHQNAGEIVFSDIQKVLARNDAPDIADILEVYYLCLLLGFKGRYAAGGAGDLRSIMALIREKIRRVRGNPPPLSPRGMLPSDAVRVVPTDNLVRKIGFVALFASVITVALFVAFKVVLLSSTSSLAGGVN